MKGKAHAKELAEHNACLICWYVNHEACHVLLKQSSLAIFDFVSLLAAKSFATNFNDSANIEYATMMELKAFLTHSPNPFLHVHYDQIDIFKPPTSYNKVICQSDTDVWCAAMQCEMDGL